MRCGAPRSPGAARSDPDHVAGPGHARRAPDGGPRRDHRLRKGRRSHVLWRPDHARVPPALRTRQALLLPQRCKGRGPRFDSDRRDVPHRRAHVCRHPGHRGFELSQPGIRPRNAPARRSPAGSLPARALARSGVRTRDSSPRWRAASCGNVAFRRSSRSRSREFRPGGRRRHKRRGAFRQSNLRRHDKGEARPAPAVGLDRDASGCQFIRFHRRRQIGVGALHASTLGRRFRRHSRQGRGRVRSVVERPRRRGAKPDLASAGGAGPGRLHSNLRHRGVPRLRKADEDRVGDLLAPDAPAPGRRPDREGEGKRFESIDGSRARRDNARESQGCPSREALAHYRGGRGHR